MAYDPRYAQNLESETALSQTPPKVGFTDQNPDLLKALQAATPAWMKDGLGIVGPVRPRESSPLVDASPIITQQSVQKPITSTVNYRLNPSVPLVAPSSGGGSSSPTLPFQILEQIKTNPDKSTTVQWGIASDSKLFTSFIYGTAAISGLLTNNSDPSDLGWVTIGASSTVQIWIQFSLETSFLEFVTNKTPTIYYTGKTTTDTLTSYFDTSTTGEYLIRFSIGKITSDSKKNLTIQQFLHSNLLLRNVVYNGRAIKWPFPYDTGV